MNHMGQIVNPTLRLLILLYSNTQLMKTNHWSGTHTAAFSEVSADPPALLRRNADVFEFRPKAFLFWVGSLSSERCLDVVTLSCFDRVCLCYCRAASFLFVRPAPAARPGLQCRGGHGSLSRILDMRFILHLSELICLISTCVSSFVASRISPSTCFSWVKSGQKFFTPCRQLITRPVDEIV